MRSLRGEPLIPNHYRNYWTPPPTIPCSTPTVPNSPPVYHGAMKSLLDTIAPNLCARADECRANDSRIVAQFGTAEFNRGTGYGQRFTMRVLHSHVKDEFHRFDHTAAHDDPSRVQQIDDG